MEKRYTVRQAVTLTGVKSYVLRYWEEELELRIGRNELGHRYYTPFDIQLFLKINELKSKGLQLKAIRTLIPPEARKQIHRIFQNLVSGSWMEKLLSLKISQ